MHDVIEKIRDDFPVLHQEVYGKSLVYLDTAATAQKPRAVLETMTMFYMHDYANIHRGVHSLSMRATALYEDVRLTVAKLIQASDSDSIVFTRGTTEALNLLAQSFCVTYMKPGDRVLISQMEHHANIIPWQMARDRYGIEIDVCPILKTGELDLDAYEKLLTDRTKLVSICHASNVLGTVNPIQYLIQKAHEKNILVCVDAAQSIAHGVMNVQVLDPDFLVFSGHKLYGPTGVGVLYGKLEYLEKLQPVFGGGSMIETVSFEKTTFAKPPLKFEPGTPPIAEVIGLGAAIEYISEFDMEQVGLYEHGLTDYALASLKDIGGISIYGEAKDRMGVIGFNIDGIHPHDVATLLDQEGIAIRAGHHCAMPLMTYYGVPAMNRISFGIYNAVDEIDVLARAILKAKKIFGV